MKKYLLLFILALSFLACSDDPSTSGSSYIDLEVGDGNTISSKRLTGKISENGEVDRYRVRLVETNRDVQIKCTQKANDEEDISGDQQALTLLMQIFEEDANGNLVMVAGDHAVEGSPIPADMKLNLFVDRPKDLYIHVRDLMDDHSSQRPYYISANYEAPPDGNDSLNSVDTVTLAIDGDSQTDSIGSVGDIDYFKFDISEAGLYDIRVDFEVYLGAGVELAMDLINQADGSVIETRSMETTGTAHMIHYLPAGSYAVVLDDEGRDDFSPTSTYTISIAGTGTAGVEVMENDTPLSVASDTTTPSPVNASIDYYSDQDWYKVIQAPGDNISVMNLTFTSLLSMGFQVSLYEINDPSAFVSGENSPLFVRNYIRSQGTELHATIKLDRLSEYYVMVTAVSGEDVDESKGYTLEMTMSDAEDNDDDDGNSNDNSSTAIVLSQQDTDHNGKIAYRGDVDWYTLTVPSVDNQVLSLYLDVPASAEVEYGMGIFSSSGDEIKTISTLNSERRSVDLKTGIQVNSGETYNVKVYDLQTDDSDTEYYKIKWSVAVATTPAPCPKALVGETTEYFSESMESVTTDHQVRIEYPSDNLNGAAAYGSYNVNTTILDITTAPVSGSDPVQITLPWVAGYVDYQGDEDWYALDLTSYLPSAPPTPDGNGDVQWYYTLSFELYSENSPVEYTLELLPDSNGDQRVNSRWCNSFPVTTCNGIQAAIYDSTPDVLENPLDLELNSIDEIIPNRTSAPCIWVGSGDPNPWSGPVYFRVRDFYHMDTNGGGAREINPEPDNDWGFDAPYYFRVKLKYYAGANHPPVGTAD